MSKEVSPPIIGADVKENDVVNNPKHYTYGNIQTIDVIEDWNLTYHEGNVLKYLSRWKHKGGIVDLQKAKWYLERLISNHSQSCEKKQ